MSNIILVCKVNVFYSHEKLASSNLPKDIKNNRVYIYKNNFLYYILEQLKEIKNGSSILNIDKFIYCLSFVKNNTDNTDIQELVENIQELVSNKLSHSNSINEIDETIDNIINNIQ